MMLKISLKTAVLADDAALIRPTPNDCKLHDLKNSLRIMIANLGT